MCDTYTDSIIGEKIYTRKELIVMESSVVEFNQDFYIPAIQNLAFHLPHVFILGAHHFGNMHQEAFNSRSNLQDVLCLLDYSEHVIASFVHQIQNEYYVSNSSVYIEFISLENFGSTYQ